VLSKAKPAVAVLAAVAMAAFAALLSAFIP
jgi:hypothetical protein